MGSERSCGTMMRPVLESGARSSSAPSSQSPNTNGRSGSPRSPRMSLAMPAMHSPNGGGGVAEAAGVRAVVHLRKPEHGPHASEGDPALQLHGRGHDEVVQQPALAEAAAVATRGPRLPPADGDDVAVGRRCQRGPQDRHSGSGPGGEPAAAHAAAGSGHAVRRQRLLGRAKRPAPGVGPQPRVRLEEQRPQRFGDGHPPGHVRVADVQEHQDLLLGHLHAVDGDRAAGSGRGHGRAVGGCTHVPPGHVAATLAPAALVRGARVGGGLAPTAPATPGPACRPSGTTGGSAAAAAARSATALCAPTASGRHPRHFQPRSRVLAQAAGQHQGQRYPDTSHLLVSGRRPHFLSLRSASKDVFRSARPRPWPWHGPVAGSRLPGAIVTRTDPVWLVALACALPGLLGCARVRPWQRERLASPAMQAAVGATNTVDGGYRAKVVESKTAGGLPGTTPGGGCGCTQ